MAADNASAVESASTPKTARKKASQIGRAQASKKGSQASKGATDAIDLLKADHRKVELLFDQFEKASETRRKAELVRQICTELMVHTRLEEDIFYPACRDVADDAEPLDEAQVEHDSAKILIAELLQGDPEDDYYDAKVRVLSLQIRQHIQEEEKARSGIFARAKQSGVDTKELRQKIVDRKQVLLQETQRQPQRLPRPISFSRRLGSDRAGSMSKQASIGRYDQDDRGGPDQQRYSQDRYVSRYGGADDDQGRVGDGYGNRSFANNEGRRGNGNRWTQGEGD